MSFVHDRVEFKEGKISVYGEWTFDSEANKSIGLIIQFLFLFEIEMYI